MKEFLEYQLEGAPWYKYNEYWVSQHNYELSDKEKTPKSVQIHDVTLRDGEQLPGVTFLEEERIRIAKALDEVGVTRIEAGMPAVSPIVERSMSRICKMGLNAKIFGFARAMDSDIDQCIACGVDGIIIEHTMNPYLCKYAYDLTPEKLSKRMSGAIKRAKDAGLDVTFMGWDWMRSPLEMGKWLLEEILAVTPMDGVTIVDTFGCTTPEAIEAVFAQYKAWFPQLRLEFHGHNDFGLGNACSLAAIRGGATVIHSAMNGLGERMGNVATEEIAMTLEILKGIDTGINLAAIERSSEVIAKISKMPISPNKPILGSRSNKIESGITTHFIQRLADRKMAPAATPFVPTVIGRDEGVEYVLGKGSGRASIEMYLQKLGMKATDEQMDRMTELVKAEGYVTKSLVSENEFRYIAEAVLNGKA